MTCKLRIGAVSHRVPWCVEYDGDKCQECGDVNALPVVNERLGGLASGALGGIPPSNSRARVRVKTAYAFWRAARDCPLQRFRVALCGTGSINLSNKTVVYPSIIKIMLASGCYLRPTDYNWKPETTLLCYYCRFSVS